MQELIQQEEIDKPVRLLGISISKLDNNLPIDNKGVQLQLNFPVY